MPSQRKPSWIQKNIQIWNNPCKLLSALLWKLRTKLEMVITIVESILTLVTHYFCDPLLGEIRINTTPVPPVTETVVSALASSLKKQEMQMREKVTVQKNRTHDFAPSGRICRHVLHDNYSRETFRGPYPANA